MALVSAVITDFQKRYPACDSTRALSYYNKVLHELATRSQFRNKLELVSVVAGVQEYDMPAGVFMIHESYWMPSAAPSSWFPLVDRSIDEYIEKRWGWRLTSENESQPTEIYTTSATDGTSSKARVGFWLCPQETTVGTYPCVGMYVTSVVDQISSDTVPTQVINTDVFVFGMYLKWSIDKVPADVPMNKMLAEEAMNANVDHIKGLQVHKPDEVLALPLLLHSRVK